MMFILILVMTIIKEVNFVASISMIENKIKLHKDYI